MNDRNKVTKAYPLADALNLEPAQLATISGVELSVVEALSKDPTFLEELEAEKLRAESDGRLLTPKARRIALKALKLIDSQLDGMDPFEAAEMLKHMQRLLDAEDRREAAKLNKVENLTTVHWTINGAQVTMEITPPAPGELQVLEDDRVEVAQVTTAPATQLLLFECTPLPIEGAEHE